MLALSVALTGCSKEASGPGDGNATPSEITEIQAVPETIAQLGLQGQVLPGLNDVDLPDAEPAPEYLRIGVRHEIVKKLQQRLMDLGFMDNDEPTDYFGEMTQMAVKHFQRQNELPMDGIVGNATWDAIMAEDAKAIAKAPGIGPKTAKRVILDLKDKISMDDVLPLQFAGGQAEANVAAAASGVDGAGKEAIEALVALGYSPTEATKAVRQVEIKEGMNAEAVLKASLKFLAF